MSAPTITNVNEKWVACINARTWIGATPGATGTDPTGGFQAHAMSGGYSKKVGTDDMTGSTSGGWSEDVSTFKSVDLNITIGWSTGNIPNIVQGDIYSVIIDHNPDATSTGNPYMSGNFRITEIGDIAVDAKAGLKLPLKGTSQGPIVFAKS